MFISIFISMLLFQTNIISWPVSSVSITVYDLSGRIVYNYAQGDYSAGAHNVSWSLITNSGNRVPSGMYLVHFESTNLNETHRLVVID